MYYKTYLKKKKQINRIYLYLSSSNILIIMYIQLAINLFKYTHIIKSKRNYETNFLSTLIFNKRNTQLNY